MGSNVLVKHLSHARIALVHRGLRTSRDLGHYERHFIGFVYLLLHGVIQMGEILDHIARHGTDFLSFLGGQQYSPGERESSPSGGPR